MTEKPRLNLWATGFRLVPVQDGGFMIHMDLSPQSPHATRHWDASPAKSWAFSRLEDALEFLDHEAAQLDAAHLTNPQQEAFDFRKHMQADHQGETTNAAR